MTFHFIRLGIPVRMKRFINTLRPRQNGRNFADDIFNCIFLNANVWIPIRISLKFVPKGLINNIPALVQIMAWRRSGDKPLSESMMVSLPTHICVTRPQWVNSLYAGLTYFLGYDILNLNQEGLMYTVHPRKYAHGLYFVVVWGWPILSISFRVTSWHWGNLMIAPMPMKYPWWIWVKGSMNP